MKNLKNVVALSLILSLGTRNVVAMLPSDWVNAGVEVVKNERKNLANAVSNHTNGWTNAIQSEVKAVSNGLKELHNEWNKAQEPTGIMGEFNELGNTVKNIWNGFFGAPVHPTPSADAAKYQNVQNVDDTTKSGSNMVNYLWSLVKGFMGDAYGQVKKADNAVASALPKPAKAVYNYSSKVGNVEVPVGKTALGMAAIVGSYYLLKKFGMPTYFNKVKANIKKSNEVNTKKKEVFDKVINLAKVYVAKHGKVNAKAGQMTDIIEQNKSLFGKDYDVCMYNARVIQNIFALNNYSLAKRTKLAKKALGTLETSIGKIRLGL